MAVPYEERSVTVEGADIRYLAWGERGRPGLVFVHGGAAHSHWWTHVAATFADFHRVVALDLSGHGDSGRRETYSLELWADEVIAVADDAGFSGPPIVIGHSMGGFVTIVTAARHHEKLAGVVVCDSPVNKPDPEVDAAKRGTEFASPKTYDSVEDAVSRFRTVPAQRNYLDYVMADVARFSLTEVDGGWTWKFDPAVFSAMPNTKSAARPHLADVRCRFALLASQYGLVSRDVAEYMYNTLGRVAPIIQIPQAGHHPMLDVPLLLITALRTLIADWNHSTAHTRETSNESS